MKKFLLFTLLSSFVFSAYSQCVLSPLSLKERVDNASLIVEAVVGEKLSFRDHDGMLKTSTTLKISKIYKGSGLINTHEISIITLGGQIGMEIVKVEPELELSKGEIGVFMLVNKQGNWLSESGPQGMLRIDKFTGIATDVYNEWPRNTIANEIQKLSGLAVVEVQPELTKIKISNKRAAPVISSFTPSTITAGTSSILTIRGSDFGSVRDTGRVQFKNPDDGGKTYMDALKNDYISWSDTLIRLIVRSKAGTGPFRVIPFNNGVAISSDTLHISFAHLNVVLGDTTAYETRHIGINNSDGYTWKFSTEFFDSTDARDAFIRSLERWRCGTYMNWDTLGQLNNKDIKRDGVFMCAWEDTAVGMPTGVLAQCFSYWSGCLIGGVPNYFVSELDIRFRGKPTGSTNWYYGTGNAKSNEFHFESVATHELGHGHQMGHVIDKDVVMHFSIANGQTKPNLSANDIAAGDYVINKSSSTICGINGHAKLNSGNCAIKAPVANFVIDKTEVCRNEEVTFTDSSEGNIISYSWNFGSGATPSSANTKGPHKVKYSVGGLAVVTLTINTTSGNLSKNKVVQIKNANPVEPKFTFGVNGKGEVNFTNSSDILGSYKWYFGDGDSSSQYSPTHFYQSGGTFNVVLRGQNSCNLDDTIIPITIAYQNFGVSQNQICREETVLYVDSSDGNISSYNWSFVDGTPSSATGKGPHLVKYSSSGNKSASCQIQVVGGQQQSYTINNMVNVSNDVMSMASFRYGYYGMEMVGFENLSSGTGNTYKWYFGDGDSSSAESPIHTYSNANNKVVQLIASGNCNEDDTTITLRDFTSVHSMNTQQFSVFPNPSNGDVQILASKLGIPLKVRIYNSQGQFVMQKELLSGENIQMESVQNGLYYIRISSDLIEEVVLLSIQK